MTGADHGELPGQGANTAELAKRNLPAPKRIDLDIVVVGGGFAGVYCAKKLSEQLRGKPEAKRAALISSENYMVFQPMLAEVAGASLAPRHVINPIRRLVRNIDVYKGEVMDIDLEKREMEVDTGYFSAGVKVHFEHLVLAVGAEIDLSRVPGMPEHAFLMQNVGDAMVLRSTIISRMEEANIERRPEVRKRLLSFVIVGGGYSGVETAGEVLDMVHEAARFYANVREDDIRVVLIHSRDYILPTLSRGLGEYAAKKLRERGLEILLNERVKAVTATKVYLQGGNVIDSALVVSTVGNAPHRIIRNLCDRYDVSHQRYRLNTDPHMRVEGQDRLWAAGDCAAVPLHEGKEGECCPQTAQFAMRQGEKLAINLIRERQGKELVPFKFTGLGELASIGHRTAVANIMGMRVSGFLAWFLWRTIYLSKMPGTERKVRVMIDWTLDLFFPRDINLLNPRYTTTFRQMHLEPGDKLFSKGEPAFSLYVVQQGCVELRDEKGETVRTVEAGDFFGERALVHGGGYIYDAVAPETAELLSVNGDAILPFFQSSRRMRRVLAKTTAQVSPEAELAKVEKQMDAEVLKLPVSKVMNTDPASLRPDQTVNDALCYFRMRRFSAYPLVTKEGQLVGAIHREDFFDYIKREDVDNDTPLEKVHRLHLPTCLDDTPVQDALELMIRAGRYKCLVVDGDHRLVGIIAVMDLLATAAEAEVDMPDNCAVDPTGETKPVG